MRTSILACVCFILIALNEAALAADSAARIAPGGAVIDLVEVPLSRTINTIGSTWGIEGIFVTVSGNPVSWTGCGGTINTNNFAISSAQSNYKATQALLTAAYLANKTVTITLLDTGCIDGMFPPIMYVQVP